MKKRFKDYEEKTLKRFKSKGGLEGKVDMVFDLYSMREYLDDLAEKIEKLEKKADERHELYMKIGKKAHIAYELEKCVCYCHVGQSWAGTCTCSWTKCSQKKS